MNTDSTVFQGIIFCDETSTKAGTQRGVPQHIWVKFGLACQTLKITMASAKTESTLSVIYHSTRHLAHHLPVKQSKRHTFPQLQTHKASLTLITSSVCKQTTLVSIRRTVLISSQPLSPKKQHKPQ